MAQFAMLCPGCKKEKGGKASTEGDAYWSFMQHAASNSRCWRALDGDEREWWRQQGGADPDDWLDGDDQRDLRSAQSSTQAIRAIEDQRDQHGLRDLRPSMTITLRLNDGTFSTIKNVCGFSASCPEPPARSPSFRLRSRTPARSSRRN